MAEIIIPGPSGRIEARYQQQRAPGAPVALILHPHPLQGGTMNNKVTFTLYQAFYQQGFNVCRFNFRGIGKSEGSFDRGDGELSDAATVMDWLQTSNPHAKHFWVAGFSFGAWIAMQLLMRRPELHGFVVVSPPANKYDFTFLAPCPVSGLILQGMADEIVTAESIKNLVNKLSKQKSITITLDMIEGANHFFLQHLEIIKTKVIDYLQKNA